jgi:hypothetical protein
VFTWIRRLFANSPQAPPDRCPRCRAEMDGGEIICPQCGHGFSPRQDPIVELQEFLRGGPTPSFMGSSAETGASTGNDDEPDKRAVSGCGPTEILFLHPGVRRGFLVRFEGVSNLFHIFTLFQHTFFKPADLPTPVPDRSVNEQVLGRADSIKDWPGPEPRPSAEVTRIPASHLGQCAHGNTWDYCPWFVLKPEGLFHDLFIGGNHSPQEIPQFEGRRIILLGRARGLRTWVLDLPEDAVAQVRVVRTLGIEEVDGWCERLINAGAGLQFEGKVGCAICTHSLTTL